MIAMVNIKKIYSINKQYFDKSFLKRIKSTSNEKNKDALLQSA